MLTTLLPAQEPMGARALGMAHASLALPDADWALFINPALNVDERSAGFFVRQHHLLPELTDAAAFIQQPFRGLTLAAGMYRFGDERLSETVIRLAVARRWSLVSAGFALNYRHIQFGGTYGNGGALGFHAGLTAEIAPAVQVGARATNLNRPGFDFNDGRQDLPRELGIGVAVMPEDIGILTLDLVKDVRFPMAVRSGLEIPLAEHVHLRGGFSTAPVTFSIGFGYLSEAWRVNLAVQRHELLGVSPGIDMILRIRN